jgi:phage terminase large subunit
MSKFIYTSAIDKIRRMTKRIKVIPGGSSAGKTFAILPILIDKAITNNGISISIVSETIPHLKRGANRDFLNIMKWTDRFVSSRYNKTEMRYTFSNGSYIEFFSVENESRLRGARRNMLYINECNNVNYEAYNQLAMRTDGDIYLDYNPSHKFWTDEVLLDDEAEKLVLTYKDNEALSDTVIKFLESKRELAKTSKYWDNWCKVYLDGELGQLEGVIFDSYEIIDKIPEEARIIGYGMDFGFTNDPTTVVEVLKLDDKIILNEIIYSKGLLNKDISDLLKQFDIKGEIYADSAEPKSITEIKRYGHRIIPAKKGKDSIMFGIQLLQEQNILITKKSLNIIDEFQKYSWKKDKEGNTLNVPIDNYNHCIDAIRYLISSKLSNNTPSISKRFRVV